MSAEYSVEEVLYQAEQAKAMFPLWSAMLTAYAERIKADEEAVPVAQPAGRGRDEDRMSDELRDFIEGMSVSVDVSTGDADAGNRYFGTVTEVMDDRGSKHGVILLVQDAEPNFALPSDARKRREAETFQVPNDTLDRLIVGRATEGDQMLAYNAITAALAAQGQVEVPDGMQPSRPKPHMPVGLIGPEDFCFCNNEVSLQSVSGGGSPEGYLGSVRLKISGEFVRYTCESASPAGVPDGCMVVPLLKPEEMQALRRFAETTEDDESYDVPKDMMAFLSMNGAVTRSATKKDWFWLTDYGRMLLAAPSAPEGDGSATDPTGGLGLARFQAQFDDGDDE